jgi:hypothetical protein
MTIKKNLTKAQLDMIRDAGRRDVRRAAMGKKLCAALDGMETAAFEYGGDDDKPGPSAKRAAKEFAESRIALEKQIIKLIKKVALANRETDLVKSQMTIAASSNFRYAARSRAD